MARGAIKRGEKGRFAKGTGGGGLVPGRSNRVKDKCMKIWEEVWDSCDPRAKLLELSSKDFIEFCKLGFSLFPKESKIDANINIFDGRTTEELEHFACTGEWPEQIPAQITDKPAIEIKVEKPKKIK